jgi:hypothetical protein
MHKTHTMSFINTFIVLFFVTQPLISQSLQMLSKVNSGMTNLKRMFLGTEKIKQLNNTHEISLHVARYFNKLNWQSNIETLEELKYEADLA